MEALQTVIYLNNTACTLVEASYFQEASSVLADALVVARAQLNGLEEPLEPKLLRSSRLLRLLEPSPDETKPHASRPGTARAFQLVKVSEDQSGSDDSVLSHACAVVLYNHGCLSSLWNYAVSQRLLRLAWSLVQTLPTGLQAELLALIPPQVCGCLTRDIKATLGAPAA